MEIGLPSYGMTVAKGAHPLAESNNMRFVSILVSCFVGSSLALACSSGTVGGGSADAGSSKSGDHGRTSDDTSSSHASLTSDAERVNGSCPSSPTKLTGTSSDGASCSTVATCKPKCCSCDDGTTFLAGACSDGVCDADVGCDRYKSSFCGSSSSSDSPDPSGTDDSPDLTQCVDGTAGSCYGTGKKWTGAVCCLQ